MIPVKVNFKYFTLYKASSLNLKIIWSKRVSFFVFPRCRKLIRRSHGSRLFVIVRSDAICFYWNEWMKNWLLFLIYKSCPVTYKSCQRESKINYYSWFLNRGTSRLIKWIYKEIGIALTETYVMLGPFQTWNFLWHTYIYIHTYILFYCVLR